MLALALSLLMSSPPNVVIIFCDDLGYGDLSCWEQRWRTPHLDAMAAEGVRLLDFVVSHPCAQPPGFTDRLLRQPNFHPRGLGTSCKAWTFQCRDHARGTRSSKATPPPFTESGIWVTFHRFCPPGMGSMNSRVSLFQRHVAEPPRS